VIDEQTPMIEADLRRARIQERLGEALSLLDEDPPAESSEIIEIVAEVLDRLRALELTESLDMDDASSETDPAGEAEPQPAVLAARRAEPKSEWLLIPFGLVHCERPLSGGDFEFTRRHAESAVLWFERLGRQLAIDYEHQSFDALNSREDGLRPAAGWIGGLEIRADGLWAVDVSWTDRARQLLATGEYRYFSPVIYWTDAQANEVAGLGPVALTNDPAMVGLPALAAARESVADTAAEISRLKRQLCLQEADTFVERGMRTGKIVEATSLDWRDDFLRDPEEAALRLSRAPVLLPPGRMTQDTQPQTIPTKTTLSRSGEISGEDLQAYDAAYSAGRVHHVSNA
jgi:hypothetical protein